jgi:hypothetical protein
LVVGKHGANNDILVQAFRLHGTSAHGALLDDAPVVLGSVQLDLVVAFGPDAEIAAIQHLVLAAGNVPVAVLAANDRQRQALGGFPTGSLMLVPRTDSELGAIARLADLASRLARDGYRAAPVADPPNMPMQSTAPQPGWALPRAEPPPAPSRAQALGPVGMARASVPPRPPVRTRRSVPPPPPRRSPG